MSGGRKRCPRVRDPLSTIVNEREREHLAKAIQQLPEKERMVLTLYYYEELTMKEIGAIFGLGEPRVCQLHAQAVLRLRGKLRSQREK